MSIYVESTNVTSASPLEIRTSGFRLVFTIRTLVLKKLNFTSLVSLDIGLLLSTWAVALHVEFDQHLHKLLQDWTTN